MPRLHLKRTPEEEAKRRKRKRERERSNFRNERATSSHRPSKRRRTESKEHDNYYEPSSSSRPLPQADNEDALFHEKIWDAFQDDERLDGIEARLNDFAHVPQRWRSSPSAKAADDVDPRYMDDEEYAEWVRVGMFRYVHRFCLLLVSSRTHDHRRTHASEHARHAEHLAALHAARALKAETLRLEEAAAELRKQKQRERERRRLADARAQYDVRWQALLASDDKGLKFDDIPWPVFSGDMTSQAISCFLLPDPKPKLVRATLRETLLRFHPDKFEGRVMGRVREKERVRVREAVGVVVGVVAGLMGERG
jgi:hypothetical protein